MMSRYFFHFRIFLAFTFALMLLSASVSAQTTNYLSGVLDVDVTVSNPCNGVANGFIRFKVNNAINGPLGSASIQIFGPPSQASAITVSVGSTFTFNVANTLPAKTYNIIIVDNNGSDIINSFVTDPPVVLTALPTLTINQVTLTNNTNCLSPDGQVVGSITGGSKVLVGGGSYTYTWTSSNGLAGLPLTNNNFNGLTSLNLTTLLYGAGPPNGLPGGTYTLNVSDNYSTCTQTRNFAITDPSPTLQNIISASGTVCAGSNFTVTLDGSDNVPNTYEILRNGAATGLNFPGTGSGPFNMNFATAVFTTGDVLTVLAKNGLCTPRLMTGSVVLTINPVATVNAGVDQTICAGGTATLAGVFGGSATSATWSGGTGSFAPNNTTLTAVYTPSAAEVILGTVTLTLTTNDPLGPCPSVNDAMTITVTPANTAGAASSAPTLCINTLLTNITHATTGATGIGVAIGLPAGVTAAWAANVITISGTPTASGTFNYSIPLTGGCGAVNATGTITVTPAPVVAAITGAANGCVGFTTLYSNITAGGVWSSGNLAVATIDPAGVITGVSAGVSVISYAVTVAGCTTTVTKSIIVNVLPTAALSGSTTICSGSSANLTVTFTGASPWTFKYTDGIITSANIISNFITFTLPVAPLLNTTYSIVSVSDLNCIGTNLGPSVLVSVDLPPNVTLAVSAAVTPLCNGGNTTVDVANSEIGVNYQLRIGVAPVGVSIVGNGFTINFPTGVLNVTTTFNILATRGVCTPLQLNNTATITVAGSINLGLSITPQAATICSGTATNIQVAASEIGVNYQLRDNSTNANIGAVVPGTGATINLPTGNLNTNTTFNILASNGTCSVQMTSTAAVIVDINPNAALVVAATIDPLCSGGSTSITVTGSEIGVTYQLRDNSTNNPIGATRAGTGGIISLPTGILLATTTFNVLATGGAGCAAVQLTSLVTVTVAGSINAGLTVSAQNPTVCGGSGTNIQITSSEIGVNYQLRDNGTSSNIGPLVAGTGAIISLPTGSLVSTLTVNILASNGTCSIQLTSLATVNVDVNPNLALATAASFSPVCSGGISSITVSGSEIGVSYQLRDALNVNVGSAAMGTGGVINLSTGSLVATSTFNVLASSGVCIAAQLTGTVTINVGGTLNTGLTITPQLAGICSGSATNIQVANSELGVTYQLRNDLTDAPIGFAVNGTGGTINLPTGNLALTTTFNVLASNVSCSIEMTSLPVVTVNSNPNVALPITAQNAAVCTGSATNIQVANSELGVSYQLRDNSTNSLVGVAVLGTGASINLTTGNLVASKSFNVFATAGGACTNQLTTIISVSVLLASDPLCAGGSCATVMITPVPSPATCTLSNGAINFNINPAIPAVNNTGVKITITGISITNAAVARTNFNNPVFPALPIGVYNYSIEYGDPGCVKAGQVTIDQSGTVGAPVASNIIAPQCAGSSTGSMQLDVPGETGNPLQWIHDGLNALVSTNWTNFVAGSQINGIPAGISPSFQRVISVRRNASDLCYSSVTITIQDANPPVVTTLTPTDATCSNNDGSILVGAISGGVGSYSFELNGVVVALPANKTFAGKSNGNYIFTVIDSKNCRFDFTTTIGFPGLVNFTTSITNPDCTSNGSNGIILLTITSSGTFQVGITTDPTSPPASVQNIVSAGSAIVPFGALKKGSYYISMTPAGAACPTKNLLPLVINGGPDEVAFTLSSINISCFENKGGVAITSIKGSALVNYNYEILDKNGNIVSAVTVTPANPINQLQATGTVNLTGLVQGNYKIRLFQNQSVATGCLNPITTLYKDFVVLGPTGSLDTLYVTKRISLPDLPTGKMLIGIKESQQAPYQIKLELKTPYIAGQTYLLNPVGTPTRNAQNLKMEYDAKNLYAGLYQLKIIDALGCEKVYEDIEIKVDVNIFIPNVFTPNNDGANDEFFIRNLPANSQVAISNRWGAEVFSASSYNNDWNGGNNADGIYYYRISAGGNTFNGWVEIIRGR